METYDGDPEAVSKRLVEAANSAGGKDNISVIFIAGSEFTGADPVRRRAVRRSPVPALIPGEGPQAARAGCLPGF